MQQARTGTGLDKQLNESSGRKAEFEGRIGFEPMMGSLQRTCLTELGYRPTSSNFNRPARSSRAVAMKPHKTNSFLIRAPVPTQISDVEGLG
jgi:hypothetical protein